MGRDRDPEKSAKANEDWKNQENHQRPIDEALQRAARSPGSNSSCFTKNVWKEVEWNSKQK